MKDDPRVSRPVAGTASEPRLQLKPDPPASEYLDGVWWPRSTQLAIELPGLVARLSDRLGQVIMVGYRLDAWPETPPQVEIAASRSSCRALLPTTRPVSSRSAATLITSHCSSSHPTQVTTLHGKNLTRQHNPPTVVSL
jgi:hypothetical protein